MWKTIPNFTRYEISTQGKVRHRRHLRILKGGKPSNGYLQVRIYNDILKRFLSKCVHQLMSLTFMKRRPPKHDVAHLDENKENNKLLNLGYLHWRKNRNKRTRTYRPCVVCGKETHGICCSKKCQWLNARVFVACKVCGKQFYRRKKVQYRYGKTVSYCSHQCCGIGRVRQNKE